MGIKKKALKVLAATCGCWMFGNVIDYFVTSFCIDSGKTKSQIEFTRDDFETDRGYGISNGIDSFFFGEELAILLNPDKLYDNEKAFVRREYIEALTNIELGFDLESEETRARELIEGYPEWVDASRLEPCLQAGYWNNFYELVGRIKVFRSHYKNDLLDSYGDLKRNVPLTDTEKDSVDAVVNRILNQN
ncbi:hypothetical protein K8R33_02645 [archaeon]|nr:hypothetical protein [archaeon]